VAVYNNGSGTTTLTFTSIVAPGQSTPRLDELGPDALTLNGGTITGAAGHKAGLSLDFFGNKVFVRNNTVVVGFCWAFFQGFPSPMNTA
jgi:hypothetical protein